MIFPAFTPPTHWFIFDVESIGLHGDAFAVAWQLFDHEAKVIPGRDGSWLSVDPRIVRGTDADRKWVNDHVPPLSPTYGNMRGVRSHFWAVYREAVHLYPAVAIAAECAWPVEAKFLLECVADEPSDRPFTAPYPLHDIASIMLAAGMDPMATYERVHEDADLYPAHHPLGDVKHSASCLYVALQTLAANRRKAQ